MRQRHRGTRSLYSADFGVLYTAQSAHHFVCFPTAVLSSKLPNRHPWIPPERHTHGLRRYIHCPRCWIRSWFLRFSPSRILGFPACCLRSVWLAHISLAYCHRRINHG